MARVKKEGRKTSSLKEEMATLKFEIEMVMKTLDLTVMEAVLHYCNKNGVEVEVISKLVNDDLKAMLREEACNLNFLRYKNGNVIRGKAAREKARA